VEQAFQPATPTFLSALFGHLNLLIAALLLRAGQPIVAAAGFQPRLTASAGILVETEEPHNARPLVVT